MTRTDHPDGLTTPRNNIGTIDKRDLIKVAAWGTLTLAAVFSYSIFVFIFG